MFVLCVGYVSITFDGSDGNGCKGCNLDGKPLGVFGFGGKGYEPLPLIGSKYT